MSDGVLYQKIRELIGRCEEIDMRNEIERGRLQAYLASRLRLSNSEIGEVLAAMMEEDARRKENRLGVKIIGRR